MVTFTSEKSQKRPDSITRAQAKTLAYLRQHSMVQGQSKVGSIVGGGAKEGQ